jgi:hypothetical protein
MATSSDESDASDDKHRPVADDATGSDTATQDEKPEAETQEAKPTDEAVSPRRPKAAKPGARAKRPVARAGAHPRMAQPQGGSLGKSMILFLIIIGGLAGAFAYFGREPAGVGTSVKWKVGDKAAVEITLVASDIKDLSCWSEEEIKERHCAFESPTKGWSKGDADDRKLLRPYTTTDRAQFLGAGLWSEPALTGKLPSARFAVKCTYTVEGKMKRPGIRWSAEGAWMDRTEDWFTGVLSDCKLVQP